MSTSNYIGVAMLVLFMVAVFSGAMRQSGMSAKQIVIAISFMFGAAAWIVCGIYLAVRPV